MQLSEDYTLEEVITEVEYFTHFTIDRSLAPIYIFSDRMGEEEDAEELADALEGVEIIDPDSIDIELHKGVHVSFQLHKDTYEDA